MWGMASQLDDETIGRLAAYFAARPLRSIEPPARSALSQRRAIYQSGLPERGVPACASCHGEAARGTGTVPRLSGQHPQYLFRQLAYFKSRQRETDLLMLQVCSRLTMEQMKAAASYAASR
jgi:cytochrome c553